MLVGNGFMTDEKDIYAGEAGAPVGAGADSPVTAGSGAAVGAAAGAGASLGADAIASASAGACSSALAPAPSSVASESSVSAALDSSPASEPRKIEDVLAVESFYLGPPVGVSMWPMLRNRHDVMMVVPAAGELRRYDVALYRRGEKYVLHRVVGHYENGDEKGYVICGDNCVTLEYVPRENVLGMLSGFYRDGHRIDCETSRGYHVYSKLWVALFPARKVCKGASAAVRHAGKRVLLACGLRKCKTPNEAGRK